MLGLIECALSRESAVKWLLVWKRNISVRISYSDIKKLASTRLIVFIYFCSGGKKTGIRGREGGRKGREKKGQEGIGFHKF